MAIDKEVIAEQYAKSVGKQVVEFCVNSDNYSYYRIDYSVRPRYIGHPHVIKIDNKGGIVRVKDLEEVYWALGNRSGLMIADMARTERPTALKILLQIWRR